ncbi:MAG: leucine-rich repeat protein [Lachnospiraceae bacterium]|nr:leucine-rich repeat protein [Lachnospiraceae bacterium]
MTKKRLRKSLGALFLVGAILATAIPNESFAERQSKKDEFQLDGDTLIKYTGTAETVSVPSAVKTISQEAFADNENIVNLDLPAGLKKISYAAFSGCNHLKKVNIPDSCEEISTAAFSNCTSLSRVTIGKGLTSLGNGVFVGCNKLKELSINTPKFLVVDGVIYNKDKTKLIEVLTARNKDKLDIPSTVTNISPYSFYGCDSLKKVNLPSNIQEIPSYSFSGCNGLTELTIPYSVNNIDSKAFENCASLSKVKIPESVSYIHDTAFDGCINLEIDAPVGSYAYKWFENFDKSNVSAVDSEDNDSSNNVIDNSSSPDNNQGSSNNQSNQSVTSNDVKVDGLAQTKVVGRHAVIFIDNTVQTVKGNTSDGQNNASVGENTYFLSDDTNVNNTEDELDDIISDIIQNESKGKGLFLPKLAIIGNKIANKAFYNDASLKEYEVPSGIDSIGDFSFARSGIESITIGPDVENIGYGAFYHCDSLSNVLIPDSVKNIEASAFDNTLWMKNWQNNGESDFLIVGDGILIAYKGTSSVVHIPDDVRVIAAESFMNHKGITEVYLPENLEKVCEGAFKGCINLKYVSKGSYLNQIEDRAFDGCPIETVRIVDSVKSIGLGAYDYTTALIDESKKVVYFHGDVLPTISYVKTSTRLSNFNYRKNVFNNIYVAVVNSRDIELKNTVLDPSLPGFRGLICVMDSKADAFNSGSLDIIACNLTGEEAAEFTIPSEMEIYGKTYTFNNDQLVSVLADAKAGKFEVAKRVGDPITVSGSDRDYSIRVVKEANTDADIVEAYKRIYGQNVPDKFVTYDISMWENDNNVLLTRFGKRKIEVSFKLPADIPSEKLHVVCLDEDKQLEDIPYFIEKSADTYEVVINVNHTGKYGIYNANNNNSNGLNLDNSPETGDFIHPKWILSLGLLFASIAMFLIKGRP